MKTIDLELSADEKALLKSKGMSQKTLQRYATDEIINVLDANAHRAKVLQALIEFQQVPSVGIAFAKDLIRAGYYSLDAIKRRNGAELFDEFERMNGYHTDPCVEDQFRLVIYHANNPGSNKKWWDFTAERKAHRMEYPYEVG